MRMAVAMPSGRGGEAVTWEWAARSQRVSRYFWRKR
jgi:hypothetical protein